MPPRCLVTGAAGLIGSHLARALLANGHEVIGVDDLSGGSRENVPQGVVLRIADCNDLIAMRAAVSGCDTVFHAAALAHEGLSVFSPHVITRSIFGASVSVFSAVAAEGVRRVVFCSSMSRYGAQEPPFTEDMAPAPVDPYGIAKVAAEQVLAVLASVHGFKYAIAVPHNVVGPGQKYDDPFRNVAAIMANRLLSGRPAYIYGDGEQTRCFSDIRDVVPAILALRDAPSGEVVNIGPDRGEVTINELHRMLCEIIGVDLAPVYVPERPMEVRRAFCSSDKARRLLGFSAGIELRATLKSIVEYVRESGPKEFEYHLPVEIASPLAPKTWTGRLM